MFAVTVRFTVPPLNRNKLLALALENAAITLGTEPGCCQYHVCSDPDSPHIVLLYELFRNREAFERHVESSHCKAFHESVSELLEEREICVFSEVWN